MLSILLIGSLFLPILNGGEKLELIPLWTAYRILTMGGFYLGKRDCVIDLLVFGIPVVQHIACVAIARVVAIQMDRTLKAI